jgi:DNA-binding MarR family transcriptional regulator
MLDETKRIERECVGGCVRKLNRMVTAIYDAALAGTGLKASQFTVLVTVANRGKAKPADLVKLLQLDESTLSRNVERMCARGWLRLEADDERRGHLIVLTERGRALLRKCLPRWAEAQAKMTNLLGQESVTALRTAMRKLPA